MNKKSTFQKCVVECHPGFPKNQKTPEIAFLDRDKIDVQSAALNLSEIFFDSILLKRLNFSLFENMKFMSLYAGMRTRTLRRDWALPGSQPKWFSPMTTLFPRGFSSLFPVRLIPQRFYFPWDLAPYPKWALFPKNSAPSNGALFPRGFSSLFPKWLSLIPQKDSAAYFPGDLAPHFSSEPYSRKIQRLIS